MAPGLLPQWPDMMPALVSSMRSEWQRHDLLANNLANVSTVGYKQDELALVPAYAQRAAFAPGFPPVATQAMSEWTDFSQGGIRETGRGLDVALNGPGFFVVDTARGTRYTRAGSLSVGQDGYLAASDGSRVEGQNGPIAIRSSDVVVTGQGEILAGGRPVGTLRIVDFPKPYALLKEGDGMFVPVSSDVTPEPVPNTQVIGGALEESNVNAVRTMVNMIELLRRYETAQRVVQAEDEANRYTTTEMGRLA